MVKIENLRNYEVLNENPRIEYAEGDYIGAKDFEKVYGFVEKKENKKIFIFNANVSSGLKEIYKKCCLENELQPTKRKRIILEGGAV